MFGLESSASFGVDAGRPIFYFASKRRLWFMGTQTLLMFVLAVVLGTADAPTRKWTDSTGQFTVEADMVDVRDGTVHLRIADGRIITVPLRELSPADQEFVGPAGQKLEHLSL